jgi:WXG100 family type VII secretion target
MNNGSNLNYGEMQDLAGKMKKYAAQMEQLLDDVKKEFNKVGSEEVWSGNAAQNVNEKINEMSARFSPFVKAIDECSNYINKTVANFEETDKMLNQQIN